MRVRYFGILLLIAVGILPIVGAGLWIVRRAESTALEEVRNGNSRVATEAAAHLGTFVENQVLLLRALGAPLSHSAGLERHQLDRILKNYRILFPTLRTLEVVGLDPECTEIATSRLDGAIHKRCADAAVTTAAKAGVYRGDIALSSDFAPVMTIAVKIDVAGEPLGVAV